MREVTSLLEMIGKAQFEAVKEENQKKERVKGQISTFVRNSRDLLTRYSRIWVPFIGETRQILMDESRKSKFSIHPCATKMYRDLREGYWWPVMKRGVVSYVEKCLTCQKVKSEHQKPHGKLQQLEILVWKWEHITMDLITKLPKTPISESSSSGRLADIYVKEVVARHGVPVSVISDRDTRFTSRFWGRFHEDWGTQLRFSTTYHHQTDGQSEKTIQTLEDML